MSTGACDEKWPREGESLSVKRRGWREGSRGETRPSLRGEAGSRTTFHIEDVMFVQGPAAEVGRLQLEALQQGCPFLPQDEAEAGLVLKPDGHWRGEGVGQGETRPVTRLLQRAPRDQETHALQY